MASSQIVGAVLAGALALGAAVWFGRAPDPSPPEAVVVVETEFQGPERATLTIHVSGAVARPGLVEVPQGSRVADVIAAAGGVVGGGNLSGVNLASEVTDGQQLVIPREGDSVSGTGAAGDGLVHLNTATLDELTDLPGVGPVLAERIVAYREQNGPFQTLEDLMDVPGIGEGKLAGLRDVAAP